VSAESEEKIKDGGWLIVGPVRVPMSEIRFTFSRSSGPGGQNVNKVNSKAHLRWAVTTTRSLNPEIHERFLAQNRKRITAEGELLLSSQRSRDQWRNVEDCLEKLRELIAAALVRPRKRRKTKPTRASVHRRLEDKRVQSARKERRRRPRMEE
jgi:ribosome-associated protein